MAVVLLDQVLQYFLMENVMEPDELEAFYKSLNATMRNYSNDSYKIVTSASGYRHMDLSSVSTRDLLNECYRRRAIEKFDFNVEADSLMLQDYPDARKRVMENLVHGLFETVLKDEKFSSDAIYVKEEHITSHFIKVLRGEVYVCKHPTKVRK